MVSRFTQAVIASCLTALPVAAARSQPNFDNPPEHSRARLIAEDKALVPGTMTTIAVVFDLDKGWHSYADSVNESGSPLIAVWSLPEGFEVGEPIWTPSHRHVSPGGILDHVYEDRAVVLFPLTIEAGTAVGAEAVISASLEWLVCDANSCVPQFAEVSLTLPVALRAEASKDTPAIAEARQSLGTLATGSRTDAVALSWEGDTLVAENVLGYAMEFIPGPGCAEPKDLLERGYSDTGRLAIPFDFAASKGREVVGWVRLVAPEGKSVPPVREKVYLVRLSRGQSPARILGESQDSTSSPN